MRNYVSANRGQIHWIQGGVEVFASPWWEGDPTTLQTMMDAYGKYIVTTTGFDSYWTEQVGLQYVLLDKANVLDMIHYAKIQPDGTFLGWNGWYSMPVIMETPRYTGWTDDSGTKRAPTPSDKGAKAPKTVPRETLLRSLETFAAALVEAGFKNTPGSLLAQLVTYIQKLVLSQPIDQTKLDVLLNEIESALVHP